MNYFDCFNGDADGICALTQLRLAQPIDAHLITGVKRDIKLLERVDASAGDKVTVLDVSLDKNRGELERLLALEVEVFYCDHHFAGEVPEARHFESIINTSADVCTSLLINKKLNNRYLDWAVAGTFGDNLKRSAQVLAKSLDLSQAQLELLENLGTYLNYNGYGASLDDLYFHPADLFKKTVQHKSALDFIHQDRETYKTLEDGYHQDMASAAKCKPFYEDTSVAVYRLPNESWARRVSGVFGNDLANQAPQRAHAVITDRDDGTFVVSVRAPLERKSGADVVCRQFATGGGRAAAAGINALPDSELGSFVEVFSSYYAV